MKKKWNFFRTLLFIILGAFNTVLIRPEDVGSWKNYLGYLFLMLAVVDIGVFVWKKIKNSPKVDEE